MILDSRPVPEWAIRVVAPHDGDRQEVLGQSDELLAVLAAGYGDDYRGRELHLARLRHSDPWIVVGRSTVTGRVCGLSYVHRNGKRGATAVLPDQRRRGLGSALVRASTDAVRDQWAEIGTDNWRQQALLQHEGFVRARSWERVAVLLGPVLLPFVTEVRVTDRGVDYVRYSYRPPARIKRYCMMTTGHPTHSAEHVPLGNMGRCGGE
jgi:GNAT superfamily N-acetyltransferase